MPSCRTVAAPANIAAASASRRSYRILAAEALLQLRTDRVTFPPYGLEGGEPGGASRNFIEIGNQREPLPSKMTMTVRRAR